MAGGWRQADHDAFLRLLLGRFRGRPSGTFLAEAQFQRVESSSKTILLLGQLFVQHIIFISKTQNHPVLPVDTHQIAARINRRRSCCRTWHTSSSWSMPNGCWNRWVWSGNRGLTPLALEHSMPGCPADRTTVIAAAMAQGKNDQR